MYKLLLALALTATANKEDGKPSGGLRGLRFAPFVNTDKGGPEASACLKEGGDCSECCGGCNPKDPINDGTDFRGEGECVCFEGTFDSEVTIHLSNHDDCANVVRQGDARVSINGEDGHLLYGLDVSGYQGDGGNFMSCVGDGNYLYGAADADKISCEGNACWVSGRAGSDDLTVVNPDGPGDPNQSYPPDIFTQMINVRCRVHRHTRTIHASHQGGDGEDTCMYNGDKVDGSSVIVGYIQNPIISCENP